MFRPSSESNKGNCQLGVLLHSMGLLLTPSGLEKCSSIEMELKYSLEQVAETCDGVFDAKFKTEFNNGNVSWNFVCLSLNILSQLKKTLKANSEEMLSISQKKTVRSCLEKVICLELLPNLLPGVGLGPSAHTLYAHVVPQQKLSDMEKYERICHITDALLDLNEEVQFHDLLVLYFLGDILSALCQLALVPYKKPQDSSSDNAVSREMYDSLMLNKVKYNDMLSQLTSKTYQPMVIKELMIIQGNKKSPTWIKRGVSQLLNKRLIQQGGVLATVRAITDASNTDTPAHSTQIGVIAKLIATPHCKEITKEDFYRLVCPQILEMLDSKESELIHIAIECCQTLNSAAFEQHILRPITKPLREFPGLEPDITRCLHRLHKSFIIPVSDLSNSSVHLLLPYVQLLFRMYCRIYQSVSHLRTFVEDLLWCILSKNNEEKLNNVFNSLIFDVKCSAIKPFPDGIEVVFGDEGGLQMVREKNEHSLEEFGDVLMVLLDRRDNEGNVGNSLFTLLLKLSTNEEHKNSIQKYLVTVKLLAVLSENSKVQQAIAKNPKQIILFIKSFIEIKLNSCDEEIEIICLALMVLTVVLNDTLHSKKPDWTQFQDLIAPLTAVRNKTSNIELRMLADEACNMIITDGGAKKTNLTENKKQEKNEFIEESDCSCEEALTDACDPLLPVRGHAMMKLAKLIRAGDKQTIVKKETILCIFQENLKHEDSFLYLTAIEGLSTLASEFPDTIMMTLIDEYSRTDRTQPDVRLKVGEALVRVIRLLGELVPTYKTELLNVFLAGTRDEDALVRTSSLVNLGDVCSLLGYRIGTISAEILQCVRSIVQTDKAVEPRRAAVMVVTMLLKGLEKDALFVLQDILKELYSTLKFVYNTDKDDVTKLHAQLALEELNSITRAFLFPPQQLSRRIYVLDAPP